MTAGLLQVGGRLKSQVVTARVKRAGSLPAPNESLKTLVDEDVVKTRAPARFFDVKV